MIDILKDYKYEFKDRNGVIVKSDLTHLYNTNRIFRDCIDVLCVNRDMKTVIGLLVMLIKSNNNLQNQLKEQIERGTKITVDTTEGL